MNSSFIPIIDPSQLFPDLSGIRGLNKPEEQLPVRPLLEHCPEQGDDVYLLRIDNSTLEVFQTCPRASEYFCVDRRKGIESAALLYGGGIHEGLEHLYRNGFDYVEAAAMKAQEFCERGGLVDPDEWRTPSRAADVIRFYVKHYSFDPVRPVMVCDALFVEKPFSLTLGEMEIDASISYPASILATLTDNPNFSGYVKRIIVLWSGRIDVAATYDAGSDDVWVVDHKTTSIAGPTFFEHFRLAQQTTGYVWALQRIIPDRRIVGFVLNAIIGRKPTRTGTSLEFARQQYVYDQPQVDEFESDILLQVESFLHALLNRGFPKSTAWCFGKYGKCQYHDVCTLPEGSRRTLLHGNAYSSVTWSPLADRH